MKIFKSSLMNRIAIGKLIGMLFGLIGFGVVLYIFGHAEIYLAIGILLWYTTLGAIIGIMGIIDKHPIFEIKMPYWIRGTILGAWMNFVLALFVYDKLSLLMQGTFFEGFSPFCLIIEGAIIGFLIDLIATKYIGDGKKLK